ncbi:MAG TPA: hypothetical protein VFZ40_15885 [Pyrinomonadaceae bacterium]
MFSMNKKVMLSAFGLALMLIPGLVAQAQVPNQTPQSSFAGKYEATVTGETGEQKITLEVLEDAGKFSGSLTTARGSFKIIKGQVAEGVLTLEIEKPGGGSGPWTLRQNGVNLTATFSEAGKDMTVEFRRMVADEISGEWDAVADASGQPFPFTLTLKLEGAKVTGSSVSQLGNSNISEGSWQDGKFAVILEGGSGKIALAATMIDGKLSGDYDYAGQLQGKWVAIRKK